jgi:hypothetical protein
MAHFQEKRAGEDRRQYKGEERRINSDRRGNTSENLEFIERARFKVWMRMTDKSVKD